MNLHPTDYQNLIYARLERVRHALFSDRGGGFAIAAGNNPVPAREDQVPDFGSMRELLTEMSELISEFETSIGPA